MKKTPNKSWIGKFHRNAIWVVLALVIPLMGAATQIDLTTQVKGILPVANGGTGVGTSTGSVNVVLSTSPTITTPTISGDLGGDLGLGSSCLETTITNDTVTGTTANLLAKLSGSAPSKVILTGTGDTSGIVGVCKGNCTTSGSAQVCIHGQVGCTADNSITAGASPPTANQVIGRSLTTTSAASTATIVLFGPTIPDTSSSTNFADDETPSGTINGANNTFTLAHSPSPVASLALFKNGQKLEPAGVDYTLSGATITTVVAPKTGDVLTTATYRF